MNTINKLISAYNQNSGNVSRIKYIVIHYVGALGGAKANCQYYGSGDHGASAHYFVDFDGAIWQCIEDANIAWHCGAKSYVHPECRNANSIGIEMCVHKRDTSHLGSEDHDWYFENETVASAIELTKYLMNKYGVPADHVIRHYDVTGKICPNPYVYNDGNHTWNEFKAALSGAASTPTTSNLYRVRKSWEDAKSQIGAYADLNNAKNACTNDYTVYDWNGKAVYTNSGTPSSGTSEADFVAKIGLMAQADMKSSYVLASVTAAQSILESGYGTTDLAVNANNIFGMKCSLSGNTWSGSTWDGSSKYTKETKEQKTDGTEYTVTADFRKYPSIQESLGDHSAYLLGAMNGSKKRYEGLKGCTDYKKAIQIIKDGGYATDVKYVDKICSIIERWNLTQYDVQEAAPAEETNVWFRVRKTWGDAKGQVGAFKVLENAKKRADENSGYSVFDESGNVLYTSKDDSFHEHMVRVKVYDLNIRTDATIDAPSVGFTGRGAFTIVAEKTGKIDRDGNVGTWGLLKSYADDQNGWICLAFDRYTENV